MAVQSAAAVARPPPASVMTSSTSVCSHASSLGVHATGRIGSASTPIGLSSPSGGASASPEPLAAPLAAPPPPLAAARRPPSSRGGGWPIGVGGGSP